MVAENAAIMKSLVLKLFEINAFKFGDFKMKVGINSPVYFDLRVIVSHPDIMQTVADMLVSYIREQQLSTKHVCGVPYTALPLATIVSVQQKTPMLVRRKEGKSYGTKKLVEGLFNAGDTCLIIEDVVTSGSSILETVRDLQNEGIAITDAVVVVDREQGGAANISKNGVRMHSLFTLSFLLQTLQEAGKIEQTTVIAVANYIASVQINSDGSLVNAKKEIVNDLLRTRIPFENRAKMAKSEVAKRLFNLMAAKKTNLCLAADLTKCNDILDVADKCGPYICLLKTHIDIIEDFNEGFVNNLKTFAKRHNFLLFEDRKFADIGNTVALQYGKGIYKIADWADLVTAHTLPGRSILQGLKSALNFDNTADGNRQRGVFLLAEMSSVGNLIDDKYKEASSKIATDGTDMDFVVGVVCQSSNCFTYPGLLQLTPGVKIDETADKLGQQYQTPEYVIKNCGADIAVVGRGIIVAKCVEKAAKLYRDRLWEAYIDRINNTS